MASVSTDQYASLPAELKQRPQWVLWRREKRDDKITKVPYNARSGKHAKSDDPSTWSTFEEALEGLEVFGENDGIGFVFSEDDELVGVDLDACSDDGVTLVHWAHEIVSGLDSYTEFSQSRKGAHTILKGKLPAHGRKKGPIEVYESRRFFAMTGYHVPGTPLEVRERGEALLAMHQTTFPDAPEKPIERSALPSDALTVTDWDVIDYLRKNPKYNDLWIGRWEGYDYKSESEADLALVGYIAFFAGPDAGRVDRIFRQSGKFRTKWDDPKRGGSGSTYGADTIDEALSGKTEFFQWKPAAKKPDPPKNGNHPTEPPPPPEPPKPFPMLSEGDRPINETDVGNGMRFAQAYTGVARYSTGLGWLVFDGLRWRRDELAAQELAKEVARSILVRASQIRGNDEERERVWKWGIKSEGDRQIRAMLWQARSEFGIATDYRIFDQKPWLFNAANGTIDLSTGALCPADPEDLITHATDVIYDPEAVCPNFDKFINEVMAGRPDLVQYVQTWLGRCLVGDDSNQELLICWGDGANGKNTLLDLIRDVMGEYGATAPQDFLLVRKHEPHTQELARLQGKRFVVADEAPQGGAFNEALVKKLTSSGNITAHFMHQNDIEFKSQFNVALMTNYKPEIQGQDHGIWRRLGLLPFEVTFHDPQTGLEPVKDTSLPARLREEKPGVLAWLVRGCLKYVENELSITRPEVVQNAVRQYALEMDFLQEFIEEYCEVGDGLKERSSRFHDLYNNKAGGRRKLNSRDLKKKMEAKGFALEHTMVGNVFAGLSIREAENPPFEDPRGFN